MLPSLGSLYVPVALDRIAIGYKPSRWVMSQLFPVVPVVNESGKYFVWDPTYLKRSEAKITRPGERAPRGGFAVSTDSYATDERKFGWAIPDRARRNTANQLVGQANAVLRCMDMIERAREITIADMVTTTTNWATGHNAAAGGFWDQQSGNPIDEIELGKQTVADKIEEMPNVCVMSRKVLSALRRHPQIKEQVGIQAGTGKYALNPGGWINLTTDMLAAILGFDKVLICTAMKNTGKEGQALNMQPVMGDNVVMAYVPNAPALDEPAAGYTFQVDAPMSKTYREEAEEQDVTEAKINDVQKITCTSAGYLVTNVLSI